jgi:hypothetical protein
MTNESRSVWRARSLGIAAFSTTTYAILMRDLDRLKKKLDDLDGKLRTPKQ